MFPTNNNFEIIDPCNNGFNQAIIANTGGDPERLKIYKTKGTELLVPKDRSYVARSTMVFANMNTYDKKKPIIGTCFELAWYYDKSEKTVIGIFDGDPREDIIRNHLFVRGAIDIWVKDEFTACKIAQHYYEDAFNGFPTFEEARILEEIVKL